MPTILSKQNTAKKSTKNVKRPSMSKNITKCQYADWMIVRYSKSFTTIEPTIFNVCEYWFNKDQNRIRDLRVDTLSQMLNLANVRPGGRYIAVDDASGLLVSAILERMGGKQPNSNSLVHSNSSFSLGEGRLITICDSDSPPAYPVMVNMNFKPEVVSTVLSSLNWATAQEDYTPSRLVSVKILVIYVSQAVHLQLCLHRRFLQTK